MILNLYFPWILLSVDRWCTVTLKTKRHLTDKKRLKFHLSAINVQFSYQLMFKSNRQMTNIG